MKKLICLILAVCLSFVFVGCGGNSKDVVANASGEGTDEKTIEIVNAAYAATDKAIKNASSLGYRCNLKTSSTLDGKTVAARMGMNVSYLTVGEDKIISSESVVKSGEQSVTIAFYDDTKNIYALKAGNNYLLSDDDETKAYFAKFKDSIQFFDASKRKVTETVILNANDGGYGFVLQYAVDEDNKELESLFGKEQFAAITATGTKITVTGLKVSGIIDKEGRMTAETVTFSYTYTVDVEVPADSVDPDNPDDAETKTETKTVNAEISMEMNFDYDISEVPAPDGITVIPEPTPDGYKKPTKVSLADFNDISSTKKDNK